MSQILSTVQMRQIRADREELERYRLTGLTPEGVVQLREGDMSDTRYPTRMHEVLGVWE